MRKTTLAIVVVTGASLLAGSIAYAQKPATNRGGRYSGAYGAADVGAMTGVSPPTPPRSTFGTTRGKAAAAPARTPASLGGTASGGISLPRVGANGTPRRQARKNSTPVLSPYLNLDPNFVNSDEGQYFGRVVPQQDFNRAQQQTQRAFEGVQREIGQQQSEIQSGLSTTGHSTSFMNLGRYYPAR